MRRTLTSALAIASASGVLAVASCGDDADSGADGGADESRGQVRQVETPPSNIPKTADFSNA